MPFQLDGKHALVTGGGSGIGAATCIELSSAGAIVTVADLNLENAQRTAHQLPNASAVLLDVTDAIQIQASLCEMKQLDILVNNAGVGSVGDIAHTPQDEFERLMRVNVLSVFLMTQAALPLLLQSHGSVVNIASVAGLIGIKQRFAYCASKGAVIAMTRQLAVDYATQLRVNCICPGTVATPFVEGYLERFHSHEKEKTRDEIAARQPVGRLGRPEEIASMVRYLCSAEANFVQGAALTIDGGWTAA